MTYTPLPGRYTHVATTIINRSIDDVWDVIADFSAVDTWAPQVTKSYQIGGLESGVGAQRHCDIKGFGSIQERVTDWNEGRDLTYEVTPLGPIGEAWNRWIVRSVSEGRTEVTTEISFNTRFGFLGRVMYHLMMKPKLNKGFQDSVEALKRRVESGRTVRPRRSADGKPQLLVSAA